MKTKIILAIAFAAVISVSCSTNDRCVSFTPENIETIKERIDTSLYTGNERMLMGQYFMGYMVMHPNEDMASNKFTEMLKSKVEKNGFKDCSNLCEVLEFQGEKVEASGMSEDEYVQNMKNKMGNMPK